MRTVGPLLGVSLGFLMWSCRAVQSGSVGCTCGEEDSSTSAACAALPSDPDSEISTEPESVAVCAWEMADVCCAQEDSRYDDDVCDSWRHRYGCTLEERCCAVYVEGCLPLPLRECDNIPTCCYIAKAKCGDGETNVEGEECDDNNTNPGDGCSGMCRLEKGWFCPFEAQPCRMIAECGNGIIEEGESCDDGNGDPGDGCDFLCRTEAGYYCVVPGMACISEATCGPNCPFANLFCGDGIVALGEPCDDGVNDGGYGECGPDCTLGIRCGDRIVQEEYGEACDDGVNDGRYDGCTSDCVLGPYCGDGKLDPEEVCDDGADNGTYGACDDWCRGVVGCGDGKLQPEFEICDDGNDVDDDYCDNTCRCGKRRET